MACCLHTLFVFLKPVNGHNRCLVCHRKLSWRECGVFGDEMLDMNIVENPNIHVLDKAASSSVTDINQI